MFKKTILVLCILFCISSKGDKAMDITKIDKEIKITSMYFPTDNGVWTDQIISSFEYGINQTQLPCSFSRESWSFGKDENAVIESIILRKPDVIFLPDDLLYKKFAKVLHEKTGAFIIFASFQLEEKELNEVPAHRQSGVWNDPPIKELINISKKIFKLESIGIVGGPWAGKMISRAKDAIPKLIKESTTTGTYTEYSQKIEEFSKKYDAIWVLAPFGVIDETNQKWVEPHRVQSTIDKVNVPVIGWGAVSNIKRTIEMSLSPNDLGQSAAYSFINMIKKDHIEVEKINSYGLKIYDAHLKKLKAKVPEELVGTIISN